MQLPHAVEKGLDQPAPCLRFQAEDVLDVARRLLVDLDGANPAIISEASLENETEAEAGGHRFVDRLPAAHRHVRAQLASLIASLEPVYGIVLATFVLDEVPTLRTLMGGLVILAATTLGTLRADNRLTGE